MKTPYHNCIVCQEIITNPLCSNCLGDQMRVMLGERDKELADAIITSSVEGDINCIKCSNPMGLCAHCFCRDVYDYLDEKKHPLAKEFMARFDFDLREDFLTSN